MSEKIRGIESLFTKPMRLLRRNITEKDKEDLNTLLGFLRKEEGTVATVNDYFNFFNLHKKTYVVRDRSSPERRIVGAGSIVVRDDGTSSLRNIVTDPEYERHGIARSIVTALLDYARSHNVQTVTLISTEKAAEFYEHIGFVFDRKSLPSGMSVYRIDL